MPSVLLGNQSGGTNILSGASYSGQILPVGGIQLRFDPNASGYCYVAFSGGVTVSSGGFALSGGGGMDGMPMKPADSYFIPRTACGASGNPKVFVAADAACSGQARMYYEVM